MPTCSAKQIYLASFSMLSFHLTFLQEENGQFITHKSYICYRNKNWLGARIMNFLEKVNPFEVALFVQVTLHLMYSILDLLRRKMNKKYENIGLCRSYYLT